MRGNLELLRRYPHLGAAEREDMLGDIERDAARLTRLVEDLLLLARSDAGVTLTRRPVDLRAVSSEALRDARLLAYGHQLSLQAPAGSFTVQGDADRLKQLLLILLDNAMKYSVPGSPVQVSLSEEPGARVLRVTDAGPGIADDALPQIYERFFRADPARTRDQGGSGLGLAIGRWISEQHEARLFVEHTGPTGTTFTVHFPLAAGGQPGNVQQGWPGATALADSSGTSSTHT